MTGNRRHGSEVGVNSCCACERESVKNASTRARRGRADFEPGASKSMKILNPDCDQTVSCVSVVRLGAENLLTYLSARGLFVFVWMYGYCMRP